MIGTGVKVPLFLLGRRIAECYPMMPLSGEVGLSIAAVSMDGVIGVGVTADPGVVPEPERLATAMRWVLARYERRHREHATAHIPRSA